MNDLRILLLDCRIELRKLIRDFQGSELCARLEAALQALSNASSATAELAIEKKRERSVTEMPTDPLIPLKPLETPIAELERAQQILLSERDTILEALIAATPNLNEGNDRIANALARIEWLTQAAAAHRTVDGNAGSDNPAPSPAILAAVAAGAHRFTDEQREWCVGEAMVLSGFEVTPMELLAQGDSEIARIILAAPQR